MSSQIEAKDTQEIRDAEFSDLLTSHLKAGYQCLYVATVEEARVNSEIAAVARDLKWETVSWDCATGFSHVSGEKDNAKYRAPANALAALLDPSFLPAKATIVLFYDLDDFWQDPNVRRLLKSLCEGNKLSNSKSRRPIVIVSSKLNIHEKLKSCISLMEFKLPDEARLRRSLDFTQSSLKTKSPDKAVCSDELKDQIVSNLAGLTSTEAENVLARCLVQHSGFNPAMLTTIKDEKSSIIRKSEVLSYVNDADMVAKSEIGGFENFMGWLERRKLAYSPRAREVNLDYPKGVVLIGAPGTGKSMVGKAAAKILNLPCFNLDVGAVFGSLVGESEQRMRTALQQIEAQRGCVLLMDEADKAWGNAHESRGDSGTTQRVFGRLLTWLAEKQDRTFVIMTMNRTNGVPPEFLRAGRFDAIFYTDLPTPRERRQIMEIHLAKRSVSLAELALTDDDWEDITTKTNQFVGAELEEVVREARYLAFERRQLGTPLLPEFHEAIASVVPMATRDKAGLDAITAFCKDIAKPVSQRAPAKTTKLGGRSSRSIDAN